MHLNSLDWGIIAGYFILAGAIGLWFSRRAGKGDDEFFASGRNLPWWLAGLSMVATTFATDTPNLVTNLVRTDGVKGNWVWWAFLLTGMVTVFLYAKLWRRSGVLTDISFYELRYSGKPAAFLRGFRAVYLGLLFNVIIMANVTLAAVKISNLLLGIDPYVTVICCCVLTAAYSSAAGLWGVVLTDMILFVVSMVGAIGAAYYSLGHPDVGGLSGLLANESVQQATNIFPDFTNWQEMLPLLIIPFAVQWWSVWYPGAEPGGGGYIAQRMLAAKDEKNAFMSTFFFNIAHYAIRPWPWILVALCSIVVFPTIESIQQAFPYADANLVGDDMAYPAMLTFMPNGMLGIVIASLAAAYMSTISTHLNWGASYLVEDFYKRFFKNDATPKHYVNVGRLATVVLMVLACLFSFTLKDALEGFSILLQIGAGTGSIYLLRWFWWRVNAWSEITGMVVSFIVALVFHFVIPDRFDPWQEITIGTAITTLSWLAVTFVTPMTKRETLQAYYDKIRPVGFGWGKVVEVKDAGNPGEFTAALACIFFGCMAVYCALFATGSYIYGNIAVSAGLGIASAVSLFVIFKLLPKISFSKD
ncbi:MAG: sodium:solute symporter family protein [Candidatus Hinthialibacter antarcticus]|nr:sodium:solute symporter family protein [Candidatus Hinthialibacter antarcticus]